MALDETGKGAESKVSRNWAWLAEQQLVTLDRRARHLNVTRLNESGSGEEYTKPKGGFFYVPFVFFTEGWHRELSLAATATLLIARSRSSSKPWFQLPTERGPEWYGVSADTLKTGFDELRDKGLLTTHLRSVRDHRARYGTKRVRDYALTGDFLAQAAEGQ
jgi:hypothetical protein